MKRPKSRNYQLAVVVVTVADVLASAVWMLMNGFTLRGFVGVLLYGAFSLFLFVAIIAVFLVKWFLWERGNK